MSEQETILITGGGGMLAQALAKALRSRGASPISLSRSELDLADELALFAAFEQHRPTLLFNCAAHTKVDLCEDEPTKADAINGLAVGTLARLAQQHGTTLVHFSTDFVFDGKSDRPYRTDDAPNPLSAYGRSKLLGEQMLQRNAPARWMLIRTAWVFGAGGACFPQTILNAAKEGKPLRVVNDQTGAPTYAPDLADATLALLDAGANGVFHFTNSGQTTWFDFTRAILDEFNVKADLQPTTNAEWKKTRPKSALRPAYSVLDTSDYTRVTGKTIRPWAEGLAAYHQALRSTT